jgi:uncharacterized small protein (DUF1192 family)
MFDDDEKVRTSTSGAPDLNGWSVAELEAYIVSLETEITRARAEIEAKSSVRNAAEALFKKKS